MFMIYLFIFATWPENAQAFLHPSFCFRACLLLSPATLLNTLIQSKTSAVTGQICQETIVLAILMRFPTLSVQHQNVGF